MYITHIFKKSHHQSHFFYKLISQLPPALILLDLCVLHPTSRRN